MGVAVSDGDFADGMDGCAVVVAGAAGEAADDVHAVL